MKDKKLNTIWQIGKWTLFLIAICSFLILCFGTYFGIETISEELSVFLLFVFTITITAFAASFRF